MGKNIPAFAKLKMPDQLLQRFQANIDATLTPLAQLPVVQSMVATFATANAIHAGTDFILNHGLGRAPTMVIPQPPAWTAINAIGDALLGAQFIQSPTTNASPTTQTILRCSVTIQANASLTFLVF
jgi:hypothetical protein